MEFLPIIHTLTYTRGHIEQSVPRWVNKKPEITPADNSTYDVDAGDVALVSKQTMRASLSTASP